MVTKMLTSAAYHRSHDFGRHGIAKMGRNTQMPLTVTIFEIGTNDFNRNIAGMDFGRCKILE